MRTPLRDPEWLSSARSLLLLLMVGFMSAGHASGGDLSAIQLLANAKAQLAQAEESNDLHAEHTALRAKVQAERACGLQAEALRTSLRALDLSKTMGDPLAIAMDIRDLSMTYRVSGQLERSIVEARNALALVLPLQDDSLIHEYRLYLMDAEMQAGHYLQALRVGEEAMRRAEARVDTQAQARVWLQMARVMLAQHKYSDALPFLAKATRGLGPDAPIEQRFNLAVDQTKAMIGIGRMDQAKVRLDQVTELAAQLNTFNTSRIARHLQYEYALQNDGPAEALHHLQRIKALDDSLFRAQVAQSIAALQVLHEVDQRDDANAELVAANAIKEATITEVRSGNQVLLALVAVLLALAIALVLTSRHSLRMVRRMRLKNEVIREQHDQIHAKNMELVRQNMRLSETLVSEEEKEVMIREIHHRIKNNLQVVDSLLGIQMGHYGDPQLERQFREAQGRIRSMALVHETIYRSTGSHQGPLRDHLEKLSRNVLVAFGAHDRISVHVEVAQLELAEEVLLPLTLLVNELLTNSIKYAFVGRDSGRIQLVVRSAGDSVELLFSDDGVGSDGDLTRIQGKEPSFGMELVGILARQLNGELRSLRGKGSGLSLVFRPEQRQLRKAS